MKKILFILLINFSMQSFAQTFVCENWKNLILKEEIQGTMFVGEKKDDVYFIRDRLKNEITIKFFGNGEESGDIYLSHRKSGKTKRYLVWFINDYKDFFTIDNDQEYYTKCIWQ